MSTRRRRGSTPGLGLPAGRLADGTHPNPVPRLDEAQGSEPATRCRHCAGEIPQGALYRREVDDYAVWFCSSDCADGWHTPPAEE